MPGEHTEKEQTMEALEQALKEIQPEEDWSSDPSVDETLHALQSQIAELSALIDRQGQEQPDQQEPHE